MGKKKRRELPKEPLQPQPTVTEPSPDEIREWEEKERAKKEKEESKKKKEDKRGVNIIKIISDEEEQGPYRVIVR